MCEGGRKSCSTSELCGLGGFLAKLEVGVIGFSSMPIFSAAIDEFRESSASSMKRQTMASVRVRQDLKWGRYKAWYNYNEQCAYGGWTEFRVRATSLPRRIGHDDAFGQSVQFDRCTHALLCTHVARIERRRRKPDCLERDSRRCRNNYVSVLPRAHAAGTRASEEAAAK